MAPVSTREDNIKSFGSRYRATGRAGGATSGFVHFTSARRNFDVLARFVDGHERGKLTGPLGLGCCRCIASDIRADYEHRSDVEDEWTGLVVDEDLTGLLVVGHALFRVDCGVAELCQPVEFFVAVATVLRETRITCPEDAEPVLRVLIILNAPTENR